jgi:glycosyltransferase involved in cell wall biosynthesis
MSCASHNIRLVSAAALLEKPDSVLGVCGDNRAEYWRRCGFSRMTTASHNMPKSVLYASYVSPYPANSGERIRAACLIKALRFLGYEVDAVVGNYDGIDLTTQADDSLRFHEIPFAWPRLRQAARIYVSFDRAFVDQVQMLHRHHAFGAILLDYGFMGAQIAPLQELGVPVVLGTHNFESTLTGQAQQTSWCGKLAIAARQTIEAAHERWFFPKADAVICVSENDAQAYRRFVAASRLHVVPNFTDIPDLYTDNPRPSRIIMTGSFNNFQNRKGLRWFVREVWDDTLRATATLCIAGRDSEDAVREFADVPGIMALGQHDDLIAEIAHSACAIVPLWQGGGTRLKCLEAMAARTPVVTTSKGCEGIAHGGVFHVADTASAFRDRILDILTHPETARRAAADGRALFDRNYSLAANAGRLQHVLESAAIHAQARGQTQGGRRRQTTAMVEERAR